MQLDLPESSSRIELALDSPVSRRQVFTEEGQGNVPEFLLSAIRNFKEGREYFECGQFLTARNKFLAAIQNLANESPDSPVDDREPDHFCIKDAIEFVETVYLTSYDQIRSLCKSPINTDLRKICLPSSSHVDRISERSPHGEPSVIMRMDAEDPIFASKVKGIVCAVLCDALSALANCEEVVGNYVSSRALHASLGKLQKLLYGDDTIHSAISLRSLARFFDALGCVPDEEILTTLKNPFLAENDSNEENDSCIASFLNDMYVTDPDRFNSAMQPSQQMQIDENSFLKRDNEQDHLYLDQQTHSYFSSQSDHREEFDDDFDFFASFE